MESFITGIASGWLTPLVAADGYTEAELAAAEARLGVRLPSALRAAYRLFGRRNDLTRTQDYLLEPSRLYFDDEDRVLVFRTENQNVTWWGVPVDSLHLEDPPVVFRLDRLGTAARGWDRFLDRLSLACIEMVLSECVMSGEVELCDNRELDDAAVTVLERSRSANPASCSVRYRPTHRCTVDRCTPKLAATSNTSARPAPNEPRPDVARQPTRQPAPIPASPTPDAPRRHQPRVPKPTTVADQLADACRTSVDGGQL